MSTIKIPQNGLPMGLNNIPFGQVFILTNPSVGITAKTIKFIEFIHSLASKKKLNQKCNTVNSLPVDYPGLMDCFICKVKTEDGVQILVSDKDSLLEMLCEFWGLDYDEVIKIPNIIPGWHINNNGVTIGGESHPVKLSVKPIETTSIRTKDDTGVSLQLLPAHTKPNALTDIRGAFQGIIYHNLDISIDEIIDLYEDVKRNTKKYHLIIKVERDNGSGKINNCKFIIEDNFGKKYPLMKPKDKKGKNTLEEWEAQWKALYLTFIWFKDGLAVKEIAYNTEFYETFLTILGQLPKGYSKPDQVTLWENVNSKFSKIRSSILEATNDTYAVEQFAIDGYSVEEYKVAGATDENRETIKKEFGL